MTALLGADPATPERHDTDPAGAVLERSFFGRPSHVVGPELLGMVLVHESPIGMMAGRIVETEAYGGPDDRASHARAGLTRRTAPMFGPPGHAYVYLVYGLHECLNVVTETDGTAGAVLLRALEPVAGVELMRTARGRPTDPDARLAAGPARLCQAMGVDRSFDGHDLTTRDRLWLARPSDQGELPRWNVARGPRVGVAYAGAEWSALPWRFAVAGNAALSRPITSTPGSGGRSRR